MPNYRIQRMDGSFEGPLTSRELKNLASQGRIGPADRISPDGSDRWIPAMRVNGIREILEARAIRDETPPELENEEPGEIPPPVSARRSGAAAPEYGLLRHVAGWIGFHGWLAIAVGFAYSYLMTVLFVRGAMGETGAWSGGFFAIILLLCLAGGVLTAAGARAFARRGDPKSGLFGAAALLPIIPLIVGGIRAGAVSTVDGLLLLQVLAASWLALAFGSVLVAIGEFLPAHADLARNSWGRDGDR